jgi:hypothetical protein
VAARLRLGHIPAGSTDAVAYSLNGTRAQETAALHIALGDRRALKPNPEFAVQPDGYLRSWGSTRAAGAASRIVWCCAMLAAALRVTC